MRGGRLEGGEEILKDWMGGVEGIWGEGRRRIVRKGDNKSTLTLTSAGRLPCRTLETNTWNPPESRTGVETGHRTPAALFIPGTGHRGASACRRAGVSSVVPVFYLLFIVRGKQSRAFTVVV